jgi:putative SOS response-associated peptidase YedK
MAIAIEEARVGHGGPPEVSHPARAAARRLRELTAEIASTFDPTGLLPLEAKTTLEDLSAVAKMSGTLVALAAKAVSDASAYERGQDRSAEHFVSRTLGTSVKDARDLLETAEALGSLPATEEAARRGELSSDQAQAVTRGASADPRSEDRLLETARRGSLGELKDEARRVRFTAEPDPEVRIGSKAFNARAETVATKPMFRQAFRKHRALVPVDGFYQWRRSESGKQPFFFSRADGKLTVFAGLWEYWEREGNGLYTCSIITTDAGEDIEDVHDRMPGEVGARRGFGVTLAWRSRRRAASEGCLK